MKKVFLIGIYTLTCSFSILHAASTASCASGPSHPLVPISTDHFGCGRLLSGGHTGAAVTNFTLLIFSVARLVHGIELTFTTSLRHTAVAGLSTWRPRHPRTKLRRRYISVKIISYLLGLFILLKSILL